MNALMRAELRGYGAGMNDGMVIGHRERRDASMSQARSIAAYCLFLMVLAAGIVVRAAA